MEAKSSHSMRKEPSRYPGSQLPTVSTENRQGSRGLQCDPSRDQSFLMRKPPQTAVAQMMQQGFRAIPVHSPHTPEEGLTHPTRAEGDPQRIYRNHYAQKGNLVGKAEDVNREECSVGKLNCPPKDIYRDT